LKLANQKRQQLKNSRVLSPKRIEVDSNFNLSPKRAKSALRYGNNLYQSQKSSIASESFFELLDIYEENPIKYEKAVEAPIFTDIISRKYEIRDETNSPLYAALSS
jgi:hypothetical protein